MQCGCCCGGGAAAAARSAHGACERRLHASAARAPAALQPGKPAAAQQHSGAAQCERRRTGRGAPGSSGNSERSGTSLSPTSFTLPTSDLVGACTAWARTAAAGAGESGVAAAPGGSGAAAPQSPATSCRPSGRPWAALPRTCAAGAAPGGGPRGAHRGGRPDHAGRGGQAASGGLHFGVRAAAAWGVGAGNVRRLELLQVPCAPSTPPDDCRGLSLRVERSETG